MTTHPDLYTKHPTIIVMYATAWCPDCHRARRVLESEQIPFVDVDIDRDPQAQRFVQDINRGNRSVPTIIFPDGTQLVEPRNEQLAEKLRLLQRK